MLSTIRSCKLSFVLKQHTAKLRHSGNQNTSMINTDRCMTRADMGFKRLLMYNINNLHCILVIAGQLLDHPKFHAPTIVFIATRNIFKKDIRRRLN